MNISLLAVPDQNLIFEQAMSFPTFNAGEGQPDSPVTLSYLCKGYDCDLEGLMEAVRSHPELQASPDRDIIRSAVYAFKTRPDVYHSESLAGYMFHSEDRPVLFLRNATVDPGKLLHRYGRVDLTDVRTRFEEYDRGAKICGGSLVAMGVMAFGYLRYLRFLGK